ncbi:Vomeronasal type-2 receptor 26 [Cricetulus griseus]|uniref:Vomeronasal type-2 receptor 26 n=1 Tax=Cricetulus griseus TaxID=10029 RepID=G3HQU1_CRIGR|nr:Vomeronasal type-2 receptor 26 [Cricetulus griseus]
MKPFCRFNLNNYQCSLAFIFATEEINRNPHLLPNTSLGFELYDIQRSEWDFLREAFLWLTGMGTNIPNYTCRRENKVVALLTGASWVTSARIGRLLNLYKYPQLPRSMCSESCVPGFRKSSQEVEPTCCYDCAPCPENEISNETDMDNCVKCPESHYANAQQNHCLEKAVTFLSYEDPLGKALSCVSLGCSLLTVGVLGVFVKHYNTPIVKANNRSLTCILLITLTFCFLCPLLFIGHPNTAICVLQQSIFAVLFTVALSTVLAKTLTVVLAFKATVPGRMVRWLMISRAPNFIIPICTIIQLGLCGIWLSISPPFVDSDAYTEHGHVIILCNKGSELAFHCVLGYLCSLALGSYTMAYFSMNLPDTFNEAKFLTFSMLMFFSVWVTFLPVYHSTKGKVMLAMEVFAILASNAGLLGCIFAPKCYIILLRPERNSLHCMKSKAHSRREF